MRKKLKAEEKKVKMTISINPMIHKKLSELFGNVSKQVEWLIYQDLRKNNNIDEMPL